MARDMPRLGRGLKGMISIPPAEPVPEKASNPLHGRLATILVSQIVRNPNQPRKRLDPVKLRDLARSLAGDGLIQPVIVRQNGAHFELVAGERRWQAAKQAGLAEIPAIVRQADDQEMLRLALLENIHREDLNAIDRAGAYRDYGERFGRSAEQMAEEFGEDRTTITNYMRLLGLPEGVREMVASGQINMGHARALLGLTDMAEQVHLAALVVTQALSVRRLEELVRLRKGGRVPSSETDGPKDGEKAPHLLDLEDRLSRAAGTKVRIKEGRKRHTGQIIVDYYSLDDFDRVAERLGLESE